MPKEVGKRNMGRAMTGGADGVRRANRGAPSKAQIALLKQYKVDHNKAGVIDNTIDGVVSDCILDIKEAIDNMIQYGDPSIYRVLPKELDEKMRAYGMYAQEYFGERLTSIKGQPVYIVPVTFKQCSKCGKFKDRETEFYTTYSDVSDGTSPICKDCLNELFKRYIKEYGVKESLVVVCQKIDMPVISEFINKYIDYYNTPDGKRDVLKGSFIGNFLSDVSLWLYTGEIPDSDKEFCKSNLHGEPFRDIVAKSTFAQIYDDIYSQPDDEEDITSRKYASISNLRQKWGNFEDKDLYWLEDKYDEWYDKCEIDGLSREKLVMQLCYEELSIVRTREKGGNAKDKVKSFQALMKDAELTPKKQAATATGESQFTSLGEFIKTAEAKGPIITKNKAFKDVDSFEKFWRSIAGAISKTLCRDSEYVKDFEENYKDYTVDFIGPSNTEEQSPPVEVGEANEKD